MNNSNTKATKETKAKEGDLTNNVTSVDPSPQVISIMTSDLREEDMISINLHLPINTKEINLIKEMIEEINRLIKGLMTTTINNKIDIVRKISQGDQIIGMIQGQKDSHNLMEIVEVEEGRLSMIEDLLRI